MKRSRQWMIALCIPVVLTLCAVQVVFAARYSANTTVGLLRPELDAQGHVVQATAPDGNTYPVFRSADDLPLAQNVRTVLEKSFAQQVLKLDRYARNLLLHEPGRAGEQRLTEPMYLLLSEEEGGFARFGFWLEDPSGGKRLVLAGYVDMVVQDEDIDNGNLEEIFSHELGHLILRLLLGDLGGGPSRNMHQSMTVTDYPTAFDEGFAEHFQPLVRDATSNPYLRELSRGTTATDLNLLWLSRLDQQLRTDGVKRNLFIHRKVLPAAALEPAPDLYKSYLDSETSVDFLHDELRNAQQMLASEGVLATLFYRLVNDAGLRGHYRDAGFYDRFSGSASSSGEVRHRFSPYENVNLKLFAAMRKAAAESVGAEHPLMVRIVNAYASLFADEAEEIFEVFLRTTYGATASQELAAAFEGAAVAGRVGDIRAFRQKSTAAFSLLKATIDQVTRGELPLDANLGPELWVLNTGFKIAPAVWASERTLPLALNLNTATEAGLMTLPGFDLATVRRIVTERRARGFFKSLEELRATTNLSPRFYRSLVEMNERIRDEKAYIRK